MYALIVPASTPFVLLATVLGLSWWEDRVLPTPAPAPLPQLTSPEAPLTETPATANSPASPQQTGRRP
ncbi:hypothetical protein OG194_13905 [Streptomyces sp. NBC_01288]|uniref:hypothetical protein n=1 Tax=Streptomyces sp. NBC_01288 TaxID=2903814 RepID=UPI002E1036AD|nr:hypothetical protein OG194_13905 [Streptomyces sp. NBC_01288]